MSIDPSNLRGRTAAFAVGHRFAIVAVAVGLPLLGTLVATPGQGTGPGSGGNPLQSAPAGVGAPLGGTGSVPVVGASASGLGPVAVVGDSNSVAPWFTPGWVEMTERLLGYEPGGILNVSIPGAMAGVHPDEPDTKSGPGLVDNVFAMAIPLDAVVIALGTNDILLGRSATEIHSTIQQLEAQIATADPDLPVFVALVAPITTPVEGADEFELEVQDLNALIGQSFAWDRVIDFHAPLADGPLGTEYTYYYDGVHHNALANGFKSSAVVDALSVAFELTGSMK